MIGVYYNEIDPFAALICLLQQIGVKENCLETSVKECAGYDRR